MIRILVRWQWNVTLLHLILQARVGGNESESVVSQYTRLLVPSFAPFYVKRNDYKNERRGSSEAAIGPEYSIRSNSHSHVEFSMKEPEPVYRYVKFEHESQFDWFAQD